jgi:TM2 domain-containing membrane protein YozV/DNA-directed RNA polymerase subunit RPC12/RpoP
MNTIEFICPACRRKLGVSVKDAGRKGTCPGCGEKVVIPLRQAPSRTVRQASSVSRARPVGQHGAESEKRILPTLLLCFFFGWAGVHRYYTGKIISGIIQLFTLGGLGIWASIDLVMIIIGAFKDKEGNKITQWT